MPAQIDKVFAEISTYTRMMGDLHGDFLQIVRRDIQRFEELTGDISGQMRWQAWSVISLGFLGASLAVAGTFYPKDALASAPPSNNLRLNANDGIRDSISNALTTIRDKLHDNKFMGTTCKAASKLFGNNFSEATQTWYRSETTRLESKKELVQTCFREGQGEKSAVSQEMKKAQESALSILQSRSRN